MEYKWIVLSNTSLSMLMGSIDANILLIALPAILDGIGLNTAGGNFVYLLWILFGYSVVTATLLVSFGRLSDIFGRVRLYNLGFAIFAVGSTALFFVPDNSGTTGAMAIIIFRLVQGVGGAFLMANGAAIITDAFPVNERGKALGINMVVFLAGSLIGLIIGGLLATMDLYIPTNLGFYTSLFTTASTSTLLIKGWHVVFLISVPVGIFGAIWSYWQLKEIGAINRKQTLDLFGNLLFAGGLTLFVVALTYGLVPYGNQEMGWGSPWVLAGIIISLLMLLAFPFWESGKLGMNHISFASGLAFFVLSLIFIPLMGLNGSWVIAGVTIGPWVIAGITISPWEIVATFISLILLIASQFSESRVKDPMFNLGLFKIRMFTMGNLAGVLASVTRGGVMIMLIILLQGIWLPLRGVPIEQTPLWAGIFMIPMALGFVIMGPISGILSDKYGSKFLATLGMIITAVGFAGMLLLQPNPTDSQMIIFAIFLFVMGVGGGIFASPNIASVMSSVPPEHRGVANGMRTTLQNTGSTLSIAFFFTIIIVSLSQSLPPALNSALVGIGVPASEAASVASKISPTYALFSAFLGINPLGQLATQFPVLTMSWFSKTIAPSFMQALDFAFILCFVLSVLAAIVSYSRGKVYHHGMDQNKIDLEKGKTTPPQPEPQFETISD